MATDLTKIVDPDNGSGTDYLNTDLWEDDFGGMPDSGDCVGQDQRAVADCRCTGGTAQTVAVQFGGWASADATRYPRIWVDPDGGYRHPGYWSTGNVFRIVSTSFPQIDISQAYARVEGVAVQFYTGAANVPCVRVRLGGGGVHIRDNLLKGYTAGTSSRGFGFEGITASTPCCCVNNCAYGFAGTTHKGFYFTTNACPVYAHQCQAVSCTEGFRVDSVTQPTTLKNCLAFDNGVSFTGAGTYDGLNNGYDTGSDPGSDGIDLSGYTAAEIFEDASADDYRLVNSPTNPVLGKGVDLSTDSNCPVLYTYAGELREAYSLGWDDLKISPYIWDTAHERLQDRPASRWALRPDQRRLPRPVPGLWLPPRLRGEVRP